jgi:hypothetical protein
VQGYLVISTFAGKSGNRPGLGFISV